MYVRIQDFCRWSLMQRQYFHGLLKWKVRKAWKVRGNPYVKQEDIVDTQIDMFEYQFSAGTEKLHYSEKPDASNSSWSCEMEGHAKKCVERFCELANKTTQQLYKVSTHASMTTTSKKKKWNLFENCHMYALKLFWNACTWHVLEDPVFILCSVNKLARSITKWPKACDKRLSRMISTFIIHLNTNSIAMWETLPNSADWNCVKTPILQEI